MTDVNKQDQNLDEATTDPPHAGGTVIPDPVTADVAPAPEPKKPSLPRTRVGSAWVGLCALAIVAIAFIIFMLQNTGRVHVTFLSMHASLPLALALLIAAVAGVLIVLAVGTIRITQLRRMARRRSRAEPAAR